MITLTDNILNLISKIKRLVGIKTEELIIENRIKLFKLIALNNGWKFKGYYEVSGKLSFERGNELVIVNLITSDVVTTINGKKMKRQFLKDEEIVEVIKDPKVKLPNSKVIWI